jgi:prepilin signal peptidase PulO-like enzyme (type II secretory pathway)
VPLLLIGFVITPLIYVYVISDDHKERRKLAKRLSSNLAPYDETRVKSALAKVDERIKAQGPVYGFGMGDVVLMAAAGLMLGYKGIVTAAFIGIVFGGIYGIIIKSRGEKLEAVAIEEPTESFESAQIDSEPSDSEPAPPQNSAPSNPQNSGKFAFGPFLGIGIVTAVYVGNAVWDWYVGLLV